MSRRAVYDGVLLDITQPDTQVQVEVSSNGKVLWVNLEGHCVLRVCMMSERPEIIVNENPEVSDNMEDFNWRNDQ